MIKSGPPFASTCSEQAAQRLDNLAIRVSASTAPDSARSRDRAPRARGLLEFRASIVIFCEVARED